MTTVEQLADKVVYDTGGQAVRLDSLWARQPRLLVFVRHFGCMMCRMQVADLQRHAQAIRALGVAVAVVGPGTAQQAANFVHHDAVELPVYADPQRFAFMAARLRRGVRAALSTRGWGMAWQAMRAGTWPNGVQGDPWQIGGMFLIMPGGSLRWAYVGQFAGDHPPLAGVLSILTTAQSEVQAASA